MYSSNVYISSLLTVNCLYDGYCPILFQEWATLQGIPSEEAGSILEKLIKLNSNTSHSIVLAKNYLEKVSKYIITLSLTAFFSKQEQIGVLLVSVLPWICFFSSQHNRCFVLPGIIVGLV